MVIKSFKMLFVGISLLGIRAYLFCYPETFIVKKATFLPVLKGCSSRISK